MHKLVDIFMKSLFQLSQDLIIFNNHETRVNRILNDFPYIKEQMSPFIAQSSLVLLTLTSQASQKCLKNNFFNRPSILGKILDNLNRLDELMTFQKPFNSYIDKQRLDVMAQFNQNVSMLIIKQFKFGRELPDLYVPVVNKLLFRYLNLWLNASLAELAGSRQKQSQELRSAQIMNLGLSGFDKKRLLLNAWDLLMKFKRKCLQFIVQFKLKEDQ